MKLRILVLLVSAISVHSAAAVDLMEIYEQALKNDPQIASAQASMLAQMELLPQSKAMLYPTIAASANATHSSMEGTSTPYNFVSGEHEEVAFDSNTTAYGIGISVTQPLFRADRWYLVNSAEALEKKAKIEYEYAQQNLILRVAEAYFGVLRAEENLTIAIEEERSVERQLEETSRAYKAGLINDTDVAEAQAAYDAAHVARIRVEGERDMMLETLGLLTGRTHRKVAGLDGLKVEEMTPAGSRAWENKALENNKIIQAAKLLVTSMDEEISRQKAGYYPTVDLTASYYKNVVDNDTISILDDSLDYDNTMISLVASVPIDVFGGTSSRVRQAVQRKSEAESGLIYQQRKVTLESRNWFSKVKIDMLRIEALEQSIVSSEKALKAIRKGYQVGSRTLLEVIAAQRNVFYQQRDLANAHYDYILDVIRLKLSAGSLSKTDLEELNKSLKEFEPKI